MAISDFRWPTDSRRDLGCEHLLQYRKNTPQGGWRQLTKPTHQALPIDGANLVNHYVSGPAFKPTWDPERIRMASSCEGSHDKSLQIGVKFVRRDNYAGANLPDLASSGWIQTHQEYIPPTDDLCHHHS